MTTPHVVVAAITAYQNTGEVRFRHAQKLITNAREAGYTVILIDDSPADVAERLTEAGAEVYRCTEKGMGAARRESARRAESYLHEHFPDATASIVVFTEPEKDDLVRWIPLLIVPIIEGRADIVLPVRNETSWESYPWFQVKSEQIANKVYREAMGIDADVMFGPVVVKADLAHYMGECLPLRYGLSDTYIQNVAIAEALRDGSRYVVQEVGFVYPAEQKAEEEGPKLAEMVRKRLWQMDQLVGMFFKLGELLKC